MKSSEQSAYSVADLGIPGLRHFVYKSKLHLQLTLPTFESPYETQEAQERELLFLSVCFSQLSLQISLVALYQLVYDAMHAKSGQAGPLKLQFMRTEHESIVGWVRSVQRLYTSLMEDK